MNWLINYQISSYSGAGGPGEKDGVLANFFNSLLNKKPTPGAGGPAGARPGTAGAGAPRASAAPASPRQPPRPVARTQSEGIPKQPAEWVLGAASECMMSISYFLQSNIDV